MPSTYAHRRFGTNVLEHLPDELRAQLEQNRELYDIGLHGPDLLFYYHAAKSNPVGALGGSLFFGFFDSLQTIFPVPVRG